MYLRRVKGDHHDQRVLGRAERHEVIKVDRSQITEDLAGQVSRGKLLEVL